MFWHARERRALKPLKPHRHDLRARLVGYHGGAVIDLHQRARDGDAPFGEDHQPLALAHLPDQTAHGHRLAWVHRIAARNAQKRTHPPRFCDLPVDSEHRLAINN